MELSVRPPAPSPPARETFLAPLRWVDGWPEVGPVELHPEVSEPSRDDFDAAELHPRWISPRLRPAEHCTTAQRPGWLTLHARGGSLDDLSVTFLGRRQQDLSCRVRALVDVPSGRGGLAVRLDERHHYEVELAGGVARVLARIGPLRSVVASREVPPGPIVLRVDTVPFQGVADSRSGPDSVVLGVESADGTFDALATLDGRYLSTEVAGGFTGRVFGVYAQEGTLHCDWFDYIASQR